ncbi:hypothetical protein [Ensifer sp.]|uniref:hypothetical protein n=1 Tax=Ensifer sp. TaxID=1872086 RepID=UPI002E0E1F55|nr:hypothetical protein [Ensifer sp.]
MNAPRACGYFASHQASNGRGIKLTGRRLLLAGHSHSTALGVPNTSPDAPFGAVPIDIAGGRVIALPVPGSRTPAYWDAVVEQSVDTTVLLVWNGNQHLAKFLFEAGKPFDFYIANRPDIAVQPVDLIPESLIREILDRGNALLQPFLKRLQGVPGCKTVLLGTPPPKGDDGVLRQLVSKEVYFVEMAERMGFDLNTITFTDRLVRRKLWLVVQDLLAEAADAAGSAFMPVPEAVMDDEGFLKKELWREDATHANPEYGRVFWDSMLSKVIAA